MFSCLKERKDDNQSRGGEKKRKRERNREKERERGREREREGVKLNQAPHSALNVESNMGLNSMQPNMGLNPMTLG